MKELLVDTQVETYIVKKRFVYVKREDLCGVSGAPTFSKIRGIIEHLKTLKQKGVNVVGYTETSISMAGWGVAWACAKLNMTAVIFDPQYKKTPEVLKYHRKQWAQHKPVIIPIPAGMAKVNYYISKKKLLRYYGKSAIMLPLGLPFTETIQATAKEVLKTMKPLIKMDSVIVNIGSGTIFAGVLKGLTDFKYTGILYGILGRSSNLKTKERTILKKAGIVKEGLFQNSTVQFKLIDEGWEYTEKSLVKSPFPCHEYYDLKAWEWLMKNINNLSGNILFWNIGH